MKRPRPARAQYPGAYSRHDRNWQMENGRASASFPPRKGCSALLSFRAPGGGSQVTPPGRLGSRWSIENGEVARANRAKAGAKPPAPCRFKRLYREAEPWCELMYPQPGNKKFNSARPHRLEQPQLRLRPCFSPYRVSPGRSAAARSVQTPVSPGQAELEDSINAEKRAGATCNLTFHSTRAGNQ